MSALNHTETTAFDASELSFEDFKQVVIQDYKLAYESRQASLLGRKEVLTGKAKFGIFGDGKEVAQVAMAKAFKAGDYQSAISLAILDIDISAAIATTCDQRIDDRSIALCTSDDQRRISLVILHI